MATAPAINFPDNSGTTTNLVVTTNLFALFFTGSVDSSTIDVQINVNGSGFVSDPTLVGLILPNFTIPNPLSYPGGLQLNLGVNTIQLRAIDINGGVSAVSTITVTVVTTTNLQQVLAPPTGVSLYRRADSVDINWSNESPYTPIGYNVYCSTGSQGTGSGYLRLNQDVIPYSSAMTTDTTTTPVFSVTYNFTNPNSPGFNSPNLQITAVTLDPVTQELIDTKAVNYAPLIQAPNYQYTVSVTSLVDVASFTFNHNRQASVGQGILNNDTFSVVDPTLPLYYVVTAVYFDSTTGVMQESRYSAELNGAPLPLNTQVRGIRIRDQSNIVQDYIGQIQQTNPTLSLIPGSTVREVHIEPLGNEVQKAYFLADFVSRSKSFPALLAIDDPNLTGTSIPVSQSQYKQNLMTALTVFDTNTVQTVIDSAFDSLAQNYGVTRPGATPSQVLQTFYTTVKPTQDLIVTQGAIVSSSSNAAAPTFVSLGQVTLVAANAQAYYNPVTARYEIQAPLIAQTPGSAGNVPAGTLDTVASGVNGLSTINTTSAEFGQDQGSNLDVAEISMNALSSLDTGTAGGYQRVALATPGVLQVAIILSGDPFMERDYEPQLMKHIGGKVDVYVKGENLRTVTESFAFQFEEANNVKFTVIDPVNLIFQAQDSRLSVSNPIEQMLYNPAQNLGLYNHSDLPTAAYDLTGVVNLNYNTIQLSKLIPQPVTNQDDFVEGDYRFISNNRFTATLQPIESITSVVGQVSGALNAETGYTLYQTQDPLIEGGSTIATDYVQINQINNVPSGVAIPVNNEQHVLIGEIYEPLDSVGVNTFTLNVYSADRTIQYLGPSSPNADYLIIPGTQTSPLQIVRSSSSTIPTGATVSVDYEHDENFQVTYVINDVLQQLQAQYAITKHATADVLVKRAVQNPLSVEATVQLNPNANQVSVDSNIRTAVTVLTDSKAIGQSIYQSDMTQTMKDADSGVNFIVQPFTEMTLLTGAMRLRDPIAPDGIFLASLSMFNNAVYILQQALPFDTTDGGGGPTQFHGVFQDNLQMTPATSLQTVGTAIGLAWIIGAEGAIITGYSDDATLAPQYITPTAIAAARLALTANHVVISLNNGTTPPDNPLNHTYSATYIVSNDKSVQDINVSTVEYLTPGQLTITYRAATTS
jgi:hypothetical protein